MENLNYYKNLIINLKKANEELYAKSTEIAHKLNELSTIKVVEKVNDFIYEKFKTNLIFYTFTEEETRFKYELIKLDSNVLSENDETAIRKFFYEEKRKNKQISQRASEIFLFRYIQLAEKYQKEIQKKLAERVKTSLLSEENYSKMAKKINDFII